ncbi:growth inhibitor PemK [Candidatus Pacearchaeota archaeon CG10_big_fil_rev_8_21_14_0_10_30_48]|nr:MAG: growth inhibitor PemK [Candidatus Pacearchaeota archaeon CG10_big_fil_rev_8_21_14_0_10_30_48]
MSLKKFDIALVKFPFSDLTKTKKRPVFVIRSLEGDNTIFCQITTKRRNIKKYEVILKKDDCEGNIHFDSFIYLDMIFTLHKSIVHEKIGEVKSSKVKETISQKIKLIFN